MLDEFGFGSVDRQPQSLAQHGIVFLVREFALDVGLEAQDSLAPRLLGDVDHHVDELLDRCVVSLRQHHGVHNETRNTEDFL